MARPVVLCTQPMHEDARALLEPVADIVVPADMAPGSLDALLPGADYLVVRNKLRPDFLEQPHKLRGIVRHGTGLDMIPMDAATKQGIPVANVPGANAQAVAEYVIGSFFGLARRFAAVDQALRDKGWQEGRCLAAENVELAGRTVGIVGMGNIGARIAVACGTGLGMRVLAYDPRSGEMPAGVQKVELEDLLAGSDFVSLCCPLTPETCGLLGAQRIALMKSSAFLVNAARGGLIDEFALADALRNRVIAGAAVDVYTAQPLAPDHPFRGLDTIVLTPHVASLTHESTIAMGVGTVQQLLQLMNGERPRYLVNAEVWPGWARARLAG